MAIEYKFFGKVVNHPILEMLSVFCALILVLFALVLSPLLVPIHFLLRRTGRNGFYFNSRVVIGKESFARYEHWPQGPIIVGNWD